MVETLLGSPVTGSILTLVGIILPLIVSMIIFVYQRTRKELSYAIVETPVLRMHDKVKEQLAITFDGKPVSDPHLVLITLRNAGNVPIMPVDYADPLTFHLGDHAEVLSASIIEANPSHMLKRVTLQAQGKDIVLEPFLFNSKTSLTLQALVSNYEGVFPTYLIAGVHTLKMAKTPGRTTPRLILFTLLYALYVLYILILFSYAGATFFPGVSTTQPPLEAIVSRFFLLLLPVALLTFAGRFLRAGIRSTKNRLEAAVLTYLGSFILGGVFALLSLLNVSVSAHLNFAWLGSSWFGPWFTIFLVGALLMFALVV
jgi:hypothetical protein